MTDTLKERLDALSEKATRGEAKTSIEYGWEYDGEGFSEVLVSIGETESTGSFSERPDAEFFCLLLNAYRSGDLVAKGGLEAAVAKAVAEEREACAEAVEDNAYGQFDDKTGITWCDKDEAIGVIRARGEGG